MFAHTLLFDSNDPWLATEPTNETFDFLTVYVGAFQDCSQLRLSQVSITSRAGLSPILTRRQVSEPTLLRAPPPLQRETSSVSVHPCETKLIKLDRVNIQGNGSIGWKLRIPFPRKSDELLEDYRSNNYQGRPHCSITFNLESESTEFEETENIVIEFPIHSRD